LENSENRRSAGRHGNQHVRLRSTQINRVETTCGPEASRLGAAIVFAGLRRP
jgi:hypothetical protein